MLDNIFRISPHIPTAIWCCRKLAALLGLGPAYTFVTVHPNGSQMEQLTKLMADGKLKVNVDRTFPLKEAR